MVDEHLVRVAHIGLAKNGKDRNEKRDRIGEKEIETSKEKNKWEMEKGSQKKIKTKPRQISSHTHSLPSSFFFYLVAIIAPAVGASHEHSPVLARGIGRREQKVHGDGASHSHQDSKSDTDTHEGGERRTGEEKEKGKWAPES